MSNIRFKSVISISQEVVNDSLADDTAYNGLTYDAIGKVAEWPELSPMADSVEFLYIDEDTSKVAKGAFKVGTGTIKVKLDADDAGYAALKAAASPNARDGYAFKLELNDKLNTTGTNTIIYTYGKVLGYSIEGGDLTAKDEVSFTVHFEQDPIFVDATAGV